MSGADKIVLGLSAFACTVFAALVVAEIIREARTTRRTRAYEASRDAAVQARRDEDDREWACVEAEWFGFIDSFPVLNHDPERLGS